MKTTCEACNLPAVRQAPGGTLYCEDHAIADCEDITETYNYWASPFHDADKLALRFPPDGTVQSPDQDTAHDLACAEVRDGHKHSPNTSELETLSVYVQLA